MSKISNLIKELKELNDKWENVKYQADYEKFEELVYEKVVELKDELEELQ